MARLFRLITPDTTLFAGVAIGYPLPHHLGHGLILWLNHLFGLHRRLLFLCLEDATTSLIFFASFFFGSSYFLVSS
jgi:hypothetical protein